MLWKFARQLTCLTLLLVLASCSIKTDSPSTPSGPISDQAQIAESNAAASVTEKPVPPLQLAVPAALADRVDDIDFKNKDTDELFMLGRMAANRKSYNVAAICQYWYVQKSKTGQYDLACYLAQTGQTDPAFYWLQKAAIDEGVDTQHAQRDADLESLRRDTRWDEVLRYMQDCNKYFESAPIVRTVLVLPGGYEKSTAIPAVVWLHGFGSCPEDLIDAAGQEYADQLNVAMIGVSATKSRGPRSFVWADDVEKDAKRIRDALAEVSDRVTIKQGQVVTLGFSQGAQVGLDVAVRNPEEFAGSIVLSPGAQSHLNEQQPSPLLQERAYVLSCGADELPGNVRLTALDADWLRRAKAKVIHKAYPGVSAHSFPQDFSERFPEWVHFILSAGKNDPAAPQDSPADN